MKFSIVKSDLLRPLSHIYSVVEKRNTIPILSNTVIEALDGHIAFTATDMEIDIVEKIQSSTISNGKLTVSAHTLYDIVRKLPDGSEIIVSANENNLILSCGKSEFMLPTLPFDDYPIMTDISGGKSFSISSVDLQNLIDNTKFAISLEETRYYLNGIFLHQNDNLLRAVATDGHRLAQAEINLPTGAEGMPSIIIPRKTVGELRKLLDDTEADIPITVSSNKIKFSINNCTLTSKLIDGSFPDYQRVIPKGNTKNLVISTKEFKEAVDRVSTISIEKSRAVKLSLSKNNLILKVNSHDSGNASEEMEVSFEYDSMEIGFNSKYLLDIALQIQGKDIQFSLSDSSSPALITDPEQEGIIFVLMPMRV
mgnify:FL=1